MPSPREYLTRLLADVVTGKLDVPEAAKNLSDENEDIEATLLQDEPDDPLDDSGDT